MDKPVELYIMQGLLFAIIVWYVHRVERAKSGFTWLDMFKDANGKPSFNRALIPTTWVASTQVLFYAAAHFEAEKALPYFMWYGIFWSGAAVAAKIVETIWGKPKE